MSGNDGWDDDAWDDEDDPSWDEEWASERDDGADEGSVPEEPRPRRTLVASPIVSTPEPLPRDEDPYDNRYLDDDRRYDDDPIRSGRAWAIVAVLVLLIGAGVALALVLASDDDGGGESASDVDANVSSTTTTLLLGLPGDVGGSTSTSVGTSTTGGGAGGAGGSSTTSTTVKPTTSTTAVEDTNDPQCSKPGTGDPATDPSPITVSFCVDDGNPKVGQSVTITGVAKDPDSQIEPECIKVTFDDEPLGTCQPQQSPSDPVINREFSVTHVFTTPGPHTIHVAAASDPPHGSVAATSLKVTVHA